MQARAHKRRERQKTRTERRDHQVREAEAILWEPLAVNSPAKHGDDATETREGGADAGETEENMQDMFIH
jgi:hypothetical protein